MNGKATIGGLICSLLLALVAQAQLKFSADMLENPGLYSQEFEDLFSLTEIPIYQPQIGENELLLENGYATAEFQNPSEWSSQGQQMEPVEVTVIFTKYPKHKEFWLTDYHWLLARRLEALFALDARFNRKDIPFNILLQTDCDIEPEAMQLFHGVLVKYRPIPRQTVNSKPSPEETNAPEPREGNTAAIKKIERFTKRFPEMRDSTVYKALDRNRWKDAVLVIDWTGSMYGYGSQSLMWHAENEAQSGVEQVVMFNDGDRKKKKKKIPGFTGGIYMEDATPATRPLKLLNKVKNRGNGGDSPENDIEALYVAMLNNPDAREVILIADNKSCIRDYALLKSLNKPVRIILCGTDRGINPQYLNLAWHTNGSLHTDSLDIENLREKVASGDLTIDGTQYTVTINNLLTPVNRSENPYRWCDRYYQLSPRTRRKVQRQQSKRDPKCYF